MAVSIEKLPDEPIVRVAFLNLFDVKEGHPSTL